MSKKKNLDAYTRFDQKESRLNSYFRQIKLHRDMDEIYMS